MSIFDGWHEIIAIRIGMKIYFGEDAFEALKKYETYDQLLSRAEFKLMSKVDLGKKWGDYAEHAPTLFKLNGDTPFEIRMPKGV